MYSPDEMAAHALEYVALGARIVGVVAATQPEHIAAIGQALANLAAGRRRPRGSGRMSRQTTVIGGKAP
jgi:hypothetical protein